MIPQHQELKPQTVGTEYGGKWIAWDDDALKIVASGPTLENVRQQAVKIGMKQPGLEFVPVADRAFVGG